MINMRAMSELCDLWNVLADAPVSDDGERLEAAFLHFEAGSEVQDVWEWFEAQNPAFAVSEAGQAIGADHPFRAL